MVTFTSNSVAATVAAGRDFIVGARPGDVVAIVGDLGAGKTHFVKGIVLGLGSDALVTSPTFTLVHEYEGGQLPIYHFDFYRLDSAEAASRLGLEEYLSGDGVAVIEWADRFPELLPARSRWIRLEVRGPSGRLISEFALR